MTRARSLGLARRTGALLAAASLLAAAAAVAQSAPPLAPSSAAPDSPIAAARRAFEQGLSLLDDQRYGEAAAEFERSIALHATPAAQFNLGLAFRGVGAYRRAIDAMERFLRAAPPGEPATIEATTAMTEMRRLLVSARIVATGGSRDVTVDGNRVAIADGNYDIELDPGHHVFVVSRPGYRTARTELDLRPAERAQVALDASTQPLPAQVSIDTNVPSAEILIDGEVVGHGRYQGDVDHGRHEVIARAAGRVTHRRFVTITPGNRERLVVTLATPPIPMISVARWSTLGGSALLLGTALVFQIVALQDRAQLEAYGAMTVPDTNLPANDYSAVSGLEDNRQLTQSLATGFFIVGAVAAATSIALWFVPDRAATASRNSALRVSPLGIASEFHF